MPNNNNSLVNGIENFICFEEYDKVPGFIVSQTAYTIRKNIAMGFKEQDIDLTPHEFALINRLAIHLQLNQKALAELTYKDRPAVTRMLHRLINKGLVEKQINNDDRRAFLVALTDEGRKLRDRAVPIAQAVLTQGLKEITPDELEITISTLKRINGNLTP